MKNLALIITIAFIGIGFTNSLNAQVTASATASARIVTPISIIKNVDMDFGNIATNGTAAEVALSAEATPTRSTVAGSGITLPNVTGTVTAAKFTVSGYENFTYSIELPTTYTVTETGGATMDLKDFTASTGAGTLNTGSQVIYVGATIIVSASQAAGLYQNGTSNFDVVVNYN